MREFAARDTLPLVLIGLLLVGLGFMALHGWIHGEIPMMTKHGLSAISQTRQPLDFYVLEGIATGATLAVAYLFASLLKRTLQSDD